MQMELIPASEFKRIDALAVPFGRKLTLIADMCRYNTLVEVKVAGSGHLGTSLSAMDIVVYLYYLHLNIKEVGLDSPERDIYFSSKGHDVPGLYTVLFTLGFLTEEKLLRLRKLGGLDGHPDTGVPGIESNSGSLGMGISKAKGIEIGKRYLNRTGRVFVMTGDGEFQEGQNYEALQNAISQRVTQLTVIMDHNKVQSDRLVDDIVALGNLEKKIQSFGWHVVRCDGHNFNDLNNSLSQLARIDDKPKFLICDTVKGKGISFMEHPFALQDGNGKYKWHSGAPNDEAFCRAAEELMQKIKVQMNNLDINELTTKHITHTKSSSGVTDEYVSNAYGKALVECAKTNRNFVVLDADLSADCKIDEFEQLYPDRFVECGIAEQDMVSTAAGLAHEGLVPVIHSFAAFLASRANEQIYNGETEKRRFIYVCQYSGLIPAGPGKSHQSVRDISLLGALPNCEIIQPANSEEMKQVVDYAINKAGNSVMIRMPIGPSPRRISLPNDYQIRKGCGEVLLDGTDCAIAAYGPVMLHEAMIASESLKSEGINLKVVSTPWLNRFNLTWYKETYQDCKHLFVLEDHSTVGGLGDNLVRFIISNDGLHSLHIHIIGLEEIPACGTPTEVLKYHGLDGDSIAQSIKRFKIE